MKMAHLHFNPWKEPRNHDSAVSDHGCNCKLSFFQISKTLLIVWQGFTDDFLDINILTGVWITDNNDPRVSDSRGISDRHHRSGCRAPLGRRVFVQIRSDRLFGQMKAFWKSACRLMAFGMFMPNRFGRRLGIVDKLDSAGWAKISLFSSKVTVLFSF